MTVERDEFVKLFAHRLETGYGWSEHLALQTAAAAYDCLADNYGGQKHYIRASKLDRERIIAEHKAGVSMTELCRRYSRTRRTIQRVVYGN